MSEVFGRIWHPGILEDAVIATLKTWLPTYLSEVCRQESERLMDPDQPTDPKTLAVPQSWAVVSEYDRFPEDSLPAVIVAAPGIAKEPSRNGDGSVDTQWSFEVSVTLTADTGQNARRNAQLYLAAMIAALLQRRSLGEGMTSVDFVGADYVDVPTDARRTQIAAAAAFTCRANAIVSTLAGPGTPEPPDPMPSTWPTVTDTDITVTPD